MSIGIAGEELERWNGLKIILFRVVTEEIDS